MGGKFYTVKMRNGRVSPFWPIWQRSTRNDQNAHTTLITHTQLFSALIVNWEEEEKIKKKKSFHRYNPRGCFIFSHRKRMEREEEGRKKE
jgi:hypothetical protein